MARGTFHINTPPPPGQGPARRVRNLAPGGNGFCILDATLAVAGNLPAVEAALDEWKSGAIRSAGTAGARRHGKSAESGRGISTGRSIFSGRYNLPRKSPAWIFPTFSRASKTPGLKRISAPGCGPRRIGTTKTEQEASNLRDAVRGMVGLGRLQVPENQPELLRAWDESRPSSRAVRSSSGWTSERLAARSD